MKLYLLHCGFYDKEVCDGVYESHVNFFVTATSFEEAKAKARQIPAFLSKRMHIDGLQEIVAVDGNRIRLEYDAELSTQTILISHKHRDLSSKPSQPSLFSENR